MPKTRAKAAMEITELLHQDHLKVSELFFQFSKAEGDSEKEALVKEILTELHVHAKVEEEVVYPVVEDEAEEGEELVGEANVEHKMVKYLMAELSQMSGGDEELDAKVTVLCELVKHHVGEEEKEMFKKLRESGADLEDLATQAQERKEELMAEPLPTMTATLEIEGEGEIEEGDKVKTLPAKKAPAKGKRRSA